MLDLNELLVFTKVVEAGSFVGAARKLDMPRSTVSRRVSELEKRLGARLLQRTTRKLRLTDVGRVYYQRAARAVAEAEQADLAVTRMQETPRGLLRVTMPLSFGHFAPMIASFLARYPDVNLDMVCSDHVVHLVEEGFDVGVRAGPLTDSMLIARRIGVVRNVVVASPAFLDTLGTPEAPDDLAAFDCAVFGVGHARATWRLRNGSKTISVDVRARFTVNDIDFLHEAAVAGLAVALLPVYRCAEDLRAGTLRQVLSDWCSDEVPVHAVYPTRQHLSPKVKAFIDHLRDNMEQLQAGAQAVTTPP